MDHGWPDTVFVEVRQASKRVLRLSALAAFLVLSVSAGAVNPGALDATFGSGKVSPVVSNGKRRR
jgi:hypothetical protein